MANKTNDSKIRKTNKGVGRVMGKFEIENRTKGIVEVTKLLQEQEEKEILKKLNSKAKEKLDIFEIKIKYLANEMAIDGLIGIEDFKIAKICIEALKKELIKKYQGDAKTKEPYRETPIKVKQWLIDKKKKKRNCLQR